MRLGKAQKLCKCCREIRICPPKKVGDILEGYNTLTDQKEKWIAKRIDKDYNNTIVQQILD